jgi:hypothetical protein
MEVGARSRANLLKNAHTSSLVLTLVAVLFGHSWPPSLTESTTISVPCAQLPYVKRVTVELVFAAG